MNRDLRIARSLLTLATALVVLWITLSPMTTHAATDAPADPARGKQLFEKRCTGCHSLDADEEGPHLRGVYGRKAGTAPGFSYSAAMKGSGITWTPDKLGAYVTHPGAIVPGNRMAFAGIGNPEQVADVVAYLSTLK